MHKIIQLISNFLYNRIMSPFMKVHVHGMNLMNNQIIQNFHSFEILKEKVVRERIIFLTIWKKKNVQWVQNVYL